MKQETLEEAKYRVYKDYWNEYHTQHTKSNFLTAFKLGAKWQMERSYSEDDLRQAHFEGKLKKQPFDEWFEQFKKK